MIRLGKLFGNASIYLGANLLNAGIPLLLLPILTRALSPADYGTVAMFSVLLTILGAFTGLSVHGAIGVRYFQLKRDELAEYVSTCIGILLVTTSALLVVVATFGSLIANASGVPVDWIFVAVVLSGFQFLANIRLSLWQASGQPSAYGLFQISQSLLNASVSLFLILVVGLAWQGRILGQSAAILIFGVAAVWLLRTDRLIRLPKNWRVHARDALGFGVPLIPHVIGALLVVTADRFIIVKFLDVAQAGIYMVALQVGQALGLVTESFNKAYAPWLMGNLGKPSDELRSRIVRGTYLYFVLIILSALAFGFLAPFLLRFMVGESFQDASILVIYIALGYAFGGCYYMVTNYVFYAGRTKSLALITLITGTLNIPVMVILVLRNGLAGAGQAYALTQLVRFLCTWWLAQRAYPMPWFQSRSIAAA